MKFNSIKFKVGNLFTIILGIILILYSGFLYVSLSRYLINDIDEELAQKVNELGSIINEEVAASGNDDLTAILQRIFSFEYPLKSDRTAAKKKKIGGLPLSEEEKWLVRFDRLDLSQDMVAFFDTGGRKIFATPNMEGDILRKLNPLSARSLTKDRFRDISINKKYFRVIQSEISVPGGRRFLVLISSSEKPVMDLLRHRQKLILVSIPVVLLLTASLGRWLADRILRPVENMMVTARKISSSDLSRRLEIKGADEEIKRLADSLNDMIARLERSFRHIEEFSSQVAHELKTPLAILRGETEVALRKDHPAASYKEVLRANLEEVEKIIRIVEDLLLLAKLDYRPNFISLKRIEFNEFLRVILDRTRVLAEEKNVTVSGDIPEESLYVQGDPLHLRRLFFNIIQNAIKFTPPEGQVALTATKDGRWIRVRITDDGPGIPAEYLSRIFERFFQVPGQKEGLNKGTGLGLNIAESIAKAHRGTLEVGHRSGRSGAVFTISLPVA